MKIDEMDNETLERIGHSDHILRGELVRVELLTDSRAMIGEDLSYWFERRRVLWSLIRSGTAAA